MNLWSHVQFCQHLKHKAEELGVSVWDHRASDIEHKHTGTVWIEDSFRNNVAKQFMCRQSGFEVDHDQNGAHNGQ